MDIPENKRLAIIAFDLSPEQRNHFRRTAGLTVSQALVAGIVDKDRKLKGEVHGELADQIAREIWQGNQRFVTRLEASPEVNKAFVAHTGHEIERDVPNYLFLR